MNNFFKEDLERKVFKAFTREVGTNNVESSPVGLCSISEEFLVP